MKIYIKSNTNTKYYYHQLDKDSKEFALSWFIRWMKKEHNVNLSIHDADELLADSNTAFDEDGLTVDNNGNLSKDLYILPYHWKDYITESSEQTIYGKKGEWFKNCLENGTIHFDKHFGGYIYDYSEMGTVNEIFIGTTEEEAFKTFCEINW